MHQPVVIIGMGEMGGVFARGLLRIGCPVYPVTRQMDLATVANEIPEPQLVLVAVGEKDLHPVLSNIPQPWQGKLGLLQNELLPRDWEHYGYQSVTAVPVWFEKKKGQDPKVLIPSPIFGPHASLLGAALSSLDIANRLLPDAQALLFELVCKNVYILTTNIAGLEAGGNVHQLWQQHRELAQEVAREVILIQQHLTGKEFSAQDLIDGMVAGMNGDPEHQCTGRSAPARLSRALEHADAAGLKLPALRRIHQQFGAGKTAA